jgi:FlaG/FlaF family flagellin (archaellin)
MATRTPINSLEDFDPATMAEGSATPSDAKMFTVTDSLAKELIEESLSFDFDHDVELVADAGSTHLTNSLKGLEKLNVDSVSLATGQGVSINLTNGEGGSPDSFADLAAGAPRFTDGANVTLNVDAGRDGDRLLNATGTDASNLQGQGIDNISLDVSSLAGEGATNIDGLFTGSGAGAEFAGLNLGGLGTASGNLGALGGVQIEVGNTGNENPISLSDTNAASLLDAGLSFAEDDNIAVDVSSDATHLSNSLKGLEKLNVDSVSLATGQGVSINLTNGEGGSPDSFADLAAGAPRFTDGANVTLNVDAGRDGDRLLNATGTDASNLQGQGIDNISLDVSSLAGEGATNIDGLFTGSGAGAEFAGLNLGGLGTASGNLGALGGVQIEVGNTGNENPISLSDTNAASLLDAGLSFAEDDNIAVDAGSTHLSTSLQGLQKLQIDSVELAPNSDAILTNEMHVNLFNVGEIPGVGGTPSISDVLSADLPNFEHSADVTLNLFNWSPEFKADSTTSTDLLLFNNGASSDDELIRQNLLSNGIDFLAIHEALGSNNSTDWLNIDDLQAIHSKEFAVAGSSTDALGFDVHISGVSSGAAISFDEALFNDAYSNIFTGTTVASEDANYGDLIQALSESGIHSFIMESGNVEITDHLASALIDAGMLTALPNESNLTLDASQDTLRTYDGESVAHLSTSLKAIGDLGVDNIMARGDKLYVDLGFPVGDSRAMQDISELLASLDPAGVAKSLVTDIDDGQIDVSLLVSADMLLSSGGFTADDLYHLGRLGINEISVMNTQTNTFDLSSNNIAKDGNLVTSAAYGSETVTMPAVQVIGVDDPLHDVLDADDDVGKTNLPR